MAGGGFGGEERELSAMLCFAMLELQRSTSLYCFSSSFILSVLALLCHSFYRLGFISFLRASSRGKERERMELSLPILGLLLLCTLRLTNILGFTGVGSRSEAIWSKYLRSIRSIRSNLVSLPFLWT